MDEATAERLGLRHEPVDALVRRYQEWRSTQSPAVHEMFEVTSGRDGDTMFIALAGELDSSSVDELDKEIRAAERSDARLIVISLQEVSYMDSSGLNLLLHARVRNRRNPQRLRFLRSAHTPVVELLEATQTASAFY